MKKTRRRISLVILAVVAILIIVGRDRIRYNALAWLVLHQNTPGETSMREMIEASPDRVVAMNKLWNTGHVAPREFVLSYLREKSNTIKMSELWPLMRPITLEAAFSGDCDMQAAAMTILEWEKDADVTSIAMTLINDVDPNVRSVGIQSLMHTNDKKFVPLFVRLLDDPDHAVRADAAGALGIMMNDENVDIKFDLTDLNSGQAAVDHWKKWWLDHQKEYANSVLPTPGSVSIMNMGAAPDFTLPDLQGNRVRLKDLRGKPVLLIFWCMKEIPNIDAFQKKHANEVTVIGITVDNFTDAETGKQRLNGNDTELSDRVSQFVKDKQIDYRVLMDNEGKALGPYGGGDPPVSVWIDSDGVMRRRFTGGRTTDCLDRMLQATLQPLDETKRS